MPEASGPRVPMQPLVSNFVSILSDGKLGVLLPRYLEAQPALAVVERASVFFSIVSAVGCPRLQTHVLDSSSVFRCSEPD